MELTSSTRLRSESGRLSERTLLGQRRIAHPPSTIVPRVHARAQAREHLVGRAPCRQPQHLRRGTVYEVSRPTLRRVVMRIEF